MIMPILAVKNVADSVAFYENVLGFGKMMSMPDESGGLAFAIVEKGPTVSIGLSYDLGDTLAERGSGVVLMVYVGEGTDMDAYYAEVEGRGATITEPLKTEYWGDQLFTVSDVDGYLLSLCKTVKQMSEAEIIENQKQTSAT